MKRLINKLICLLFGHLDEIEVVRARPIETKAMYFGLAGRTLWYRHTCARCGRVEEW